MTESSTLLIGVDGGATEIKAHAVQCGDLRQTRDFSLRPESAARVYPAAEGFAPVPVGEQLTQRDERKIRHSEEEVEQGRLWVAAAAEAIVEAAGLAGERRLLVGIGMPGLKTPDGRGINVINNGPRIPDYLEQLERRLREAGLTLRSPIAALGSDADYCGLGEECAADGLFRDVSNAYYVGCGTGIADALKLNGRLLPFDHAKTWIQKSWQMATACGPTFEKLISAKSLNQIYANLNATRAADAAAGSAEPLFPEEAAIQGDAVARGWLASAALILAELIFERLGTIKNGRARAGHRGSAYAGLAGHHEYLGTLLERVIVGQRLGLILGDARCRELFGEKLDAALAGFIVAGGDAEMIAAYVGAERAGNATVAALKPGFLRASSLRAAPALGAAVAALRAFPLMQTRGSQHRSDTLRLPSLNPESFYSLSR